MTGSDPCLPTLEVRAGGREDIAVTEAADPEST